MILKELKLRVPNQNLVTNCYIVVDEESGETMVVDPGSEPEKVVEMLDLLGIQSVKYIFLTHCHYDHICGISEVRNQKGGKILISREDSKRII